MVMPVSFAASPSLGMRMSVFSSSSAGSGVSGIGAGLSTTVAPLFLASRAAAMSVGMGVSSCMSTTAASCMTEAASAMSAGERRLLAPLSTMIVFSPPELMVMSATPEGLRAVCVTWVTSMPSLLSFAIVLSPLASWPSLATKATSAPKRAVATA